MTPDRKPPRYSKAKPLDPVKRKRTKRDYEVAAAGGVVTRVTKKGNLRVAIVHRPRYDDWSLPKGGLNKKESFKAAALREVREETGLRCRLGEEMEACRYRDGRGRKKIVRWWRMSVRKGKLADFEPNDEIDQARWMSIGRAIETVDYEHDRKLLRSLIE